MSRSAFNKRGHGPVAFCCAALLISGTTFGQTREVFHTGFEKDEGFDMQYTLVGQGGWLGQGTGGNGLVVKYFEDFGQQAYIGFHKPDESQEFLNVWRPLNLSPLLPEEKLVTFSVLMQIVDSTNDQFDDFRWSVYNTLEHRLFTLDFDNSNKDISHALDNGEGFKPTGFSFDNAGLYELIIRMNFMDNQWSALINDTIVADKLPITTQNAHLDLGDIDAVWAIRTLETPGNNYIVFDDYTVSVGPPVSRHPSLELVEILAKGQVLLKLSGEPWIRYTLEGSTDLETWTPVKTSSSADGVFEVLDSGAHGHSRRFYRARTQSP